MTRVYWDFKLRIESKTLVHTHDILEALKEALDKARDVSSYELEEAFK